MSYLNQTYVIFDADEDAWAYRFMRGWKENERVNFDFRDAHDLDSMTSRAQDEYYVKSNLRRRMEKSAAVLVLIGEKTKNLYRFVRWELELALELDLPIIGVNLNDKRMQDNERCPPIIRDRCVIHIPFKMAAIKYALDAWPGGYRGLSAQEKAKGWRYFNDGVYQSLGV